MAYFVLVYMSLARDTVEKDPLPIWERILYFSNYFRDDKNLIMVASLLLKASMVWIT